MKMVTLTVSVDLDGALLINSDLTLFVETFVTTMDLLRQDSQDCLASFMGVVSGPLRAVFQSGEIYDTRARHILNEFVRHDIDKAHADHLNESLYNLAWRNWAMIEKVWLHYRGTFDKMLDILLVGSGSSTQ